MECEAICDSAKKMKGKRNYSISYPQVGDSKNRPVQTILVNKCSEILVICRYKNINKKQTNMLKGGHWQI